MIAKTSTTQNAIRAARLVAGVPTLLLIALAALAPLASLGSQSSASSQSFSTSRTSPATETAGPSSATAPATNLWQPLIFAAALIGLTSPAIAHRLYLSFKNRVAQPPNPTLACRLFLQANVLTFGLSEAAALFGIAVYAFTDALFALTGMVTHVILVGALWPSHERLQWFVEPGDG